jgi:hypothetical protein
MTCVLAPAKPDSLLVRVFRHRGHVVHEKAFADRLGFLPATYFICPSIAAGKIGTGPTPDQAVADKLAKREREAA